MKYGVGWFGVPGANGRWSTMTHAIDKRGRVLCGYKPAKRMQYQHCGNPRMIVPECNKCARLVAKEGK